VAQNILYKNATCMMHVGKTLHMKTLFSAEGVVVMLFCFCFRNVWQEMG